SSGKGGNLSIHAGSLSIDGSATPDLFTGISTETFNDGDAGTMTIAIDKLLSIVGGGQILADTSSTGKGANVTVHAGSLSIDGSAMSDFVTGIFVASDRGTNGATGDAGKLTIAVDNLLSIVGGGEIAADTFSSGKGGDVTVHAGSLSIDASATSDFVTGIFVDSYSGATGDGGMLSITGPMILRHGACSEM